MTYKGKRWIMKRDAILCRDKYKCRECARFGRVMSADTVHHVNPAEMCPELFWDSTNLISLCRKCHNKMHVRDEHELSELGKDWVVRIEREKQSRRP